MLLESRWRWKNGITDACSTADFCQLLIYCPRHAPDDSPDMYQMMPQTCPKWCPDVAKEILENIDINKTFNRLEFVISNRASWVGNLFQEHRYAMLVSASEEAAVRVIPFGLFPIICSSDIQHDIIPNIPNYNVQLLKEHLSTLSSISDNISSNIQHDFH